MNGFVKQVVGCLLVSGCLLGTAVLMAQDDQPFSISAAQRAALGVTTAMPVAADSRAMGPLPARVVVPNSGRRTLSSVVAASVMSVEVTSGSRVEAGQPLIVISGPEVVALQQELVVARQEEAVVKAKLKGDQALSREGAITERRLLQSQADAVAGRSRVLAAESALQVAGVSAQAIAALKGADDLSTQLTLVAPFAGVITEQNVLPGQRVEAGAHMLELVRTDDLQLEIHTPVSQCGEQFEGRQVTVSGFDATAMITTVGCTIHAEDQGVLLRATLEDANSELRPGQLVDVSLDLAIADGQVWRVHRTGVTRYGGVLYVFTANGDAFNAVPVTDVAQEYDTWLVQGDIRADVELAVTGAVALKAVWLGEGGEE